MWGKIGKFLDYPETWCDLFVTLGKWAFVILIFGVCIGVILAPYLILFDLLSIRVQEGKEWAALSVLFTLSFIFKYGMHSFLSEVTSWYPELLDKLPSCPKINWNKGE